MALVPAFISFDFEHDQDLRTMLVGQSNFPNSPFAIADYSLKEPLTGNWTQKIEGRIKRTKVMIVICGERTHLASGVSEEIKIAQKLAIPYFLLWGRKEKTCTPPAVASKDLIYEWSWSNLQALVGGSR